MEAIATTAQSCAEVASNEVCFGHKAIDTVVNCDTPPAFISPGDRVSLDATCALRSGAMQTPGEWGVAVMKVPANDAGQDITFVMFGDVQVQNAASARSEMQVWVESDTEVRSGPGSHFSSLQTLAAGTVIRANACNCTRNWLRTVLDNRQVGWIPANRITILGDAEALPIVQADTPVYNSMQAFSLQSGAQQPECAEAPENGILIQAPSGLENVPLQINGVEIALNSTMFVQSQPGGDLTIEVLDGTARVTANDFSAYMLEGMRAVVPMSKDNLPTGLMRVELYASEDVAHLPLTLLPDLIDLATMPERETAHIVGVEKCTVLADRGETICAVHFVNPDGDAITRMDVEFVNAPQGKWNSSAQEPPALLDGDNISGRLAWNATCSLGGEIFIGPVVWSITLTDAQGNVSEPFEASFNCVD